MSTTEQQEKPKLPFDKNGELDTKQFARDIGKFLKDAVNTMTEINLSRNPDALSNVEIKPDNKTKKWQK